MNEDEKKAIDMLEKYITEHKFYNIKQSDGLEDNIKILLDLYMQEKEKNKELENADLTIVYMNGFYEGENKWKDKIREVLEKYKYTEIGDSMKIIAFYKAIQELLERRGLKCQ